MHVHRAYFPTFSGDYHYFYLFFYYLFSTARFTAVQNLVLLKTDVLLGFNALLDLGISCTTPSQSPYFSSVPTFLLSELPLDGFLLSAPRVRVFKNPAVAPVRDLARSGEICWQG